VSTVVCRDDDGEHFLMVNYKWLIVSAKIRNFHHIVSRRGGEKTEIFSLWYSVFSVVKKN